MDILCHFLFMLLFLFIAACCVGYVVGIVWLIYKIAWLVHTESGEDNVRDNDN